MALFHVWTIAASLGALAELAYLANAAPAHLPRAVGVALLYILGVAYQVRTATRTQAPMSRRFRVTIAVAASAVFGLGAIVFVAAVTATLAMLY
jgi:hypothetical protein